MRGEGAEGRRAGRGYGAELEPLVTRLEGNAIATDAGFQACPHRELLTRSEGQAAKGAHAPRTRLRSGQVDPSPKSERGSLPSLALPAACGGRRSFACRATPSPIMTAYKNEKGRLTPPFVRVLGRARRRARACSSHVGRTRQRRLQVGAGRSCEGAGEGLVCSWARRAQSSPGPRLAESTGHALEASTDAFADLEGRDCRSEPAATCLIPVRSGASVVVADRNGGQLS